MLNRQQVSASAIKLLGPLDYSAQVQLWAMGPIINRQSATGAKVYISHHRSECNAQKGVPLPTETVVTIDMGPNDELFAYATDQSLLGMSVIKRQP